MGNRRLLQRLTAGLVLAGAISRTNAQEQTTGTDVSSTPTQSGTSSNGASAASSTLRSESTSTDVPLELWGIANSLLSSYYPSTTISNVASLTWPSVVVIDSSTYTRSPPTTSPSTLATASISSQDVSRPVTTDSSTNDAEPSDSPEKPAAGQPKDRTLGIALGVVFGVLALGLMAFALLCVHRRQKKHGGVGLFPSRRRRPGSPTDSEVGAWRSRHPHMSLVANISSDRPMSQVRDNDNDRPSREWVDRYNRLSDQQTPPAHLHPAFMHRHNDSVGTMSESNPFFPPADHDQSPQQQNIGASRYYERTNEYHPGYPKIVSNVPTTPYTPYKPEEEETRRSTSFHTDRHRRRSSFSTIHSDDGDVDLERNSRPPTPFSPMMMLQTSLPPFQQQQQRESPPQAQQAPSQHQPQHQQQHRASNPFTSTEDHMYQYEELNPHSQQEQHQQEQHQQQQQQQQQHHQSHPHPNPQHYQEIHQNEDQEQEDHNDIISPMLQQHPQIPPSKSPARRYSPLVHYPSWSEVSEFDFTTGGGSGGESSVSPLSSSAATGSRLRGRGSGGQDVYGRDRESVVGRTELA